MTPNSMIELRCLLPKNATIGKEYRMTTTAKTMVRKSGVALKSFVPNRKAFFRPRIVIILIPNVRRETLSINKQH